MLNQSPASIPPDSIPISFAMIGKILLADSGTGHSAEMLKMLLEIPELKKASITILHVVPAQLNPESLTEKWEEGGKILATAVQSLGLEPTSVTTILRQGDPKTVVCQVADEVNADLIIMGSRGLKRLQSILQNSVSQYVFQLSSRAMLLVKDDIYVKRINRVMVALDKSDASQAALKMARSTGSVSIRRERRWQSLPGPCGCGTCPPILPPCDMKLPWRGSHFGGHLEWRSARTGVLCFTSTAHSCAVGNTPARSLKWPRRL